MHGWAGLLVQAKGKKYQHKTALRGFFFFFFEKHIYKQKPFDRFLSRLFMEYPLFPSLSRTLQLCFVRRCWATEPTASLSRAIAICRCERQGSRVYAVSFAGWTRSIIKNVPEVSTTLKEKNRTNRTLSGEAHTRRVLWCACFELCR